MKVLLLDADNRTAILSTIALPTPGPNELLVAVKAIAPHPVDGDVVVGCDFAGLVVARGPPASTSSSSPSYPSDDTTPGPNGGGSRLRRSSTALSASVNRGDRVAGSLPLLPSRGGNEGEAAAAATTPALAEYVVCPADLVWRVPARVALEDAAAVGRCALAAAQALFLRMGLPAPFGWEDDSDDGVLQRAAGEDADDAAGERGDKGEEEGGRAEGEEFTLLVARASTGAGRYAAQLARRSAEASGRRARLVGAAGPRDWDALRAKPYGFDVLVDHGDVGWPARARAGGGGVDFALDVTAGVSRGDVEGAAAAVGDVRSALRQGGRMAVVDARGVGPVGPLSSGSAERAFATAFYKWLSDGGLLRPNPVRVVPGGLERLVEDYGLGLLGSGLLSSDGKDEKTESHLRSIVGERLVYRIEGERRGSVGAGGTQVD